MSPKKLGGMIKELRERQGLTQAELAKRALVSQGYIAKLEPSARTGQDKTVRHGNPSVAVLQRLAKALGVDIAMLMGSGDVRHPRTIMTAHLPTFFKIQLREAAQGKHSYRYVGWHLGHYHPDLFDLEQHDVSEIGDEALGRPTQTLRGLFASEEHPRGDLVDYVPAARRRAFLRGLIEGLSGAEWGEEE